MQGGGQRLRLGGREGGDCGYVPRPSCCASVSPPAGDGAHPLALRETLAGGLWLCTIVLSLTPGQGLCWGLA